MFLSLMIWQNEFVLKFNMPGKKICLIVAQVLNL